MKMMYDKQVFINEMCKFIDNYINACNENYVEQKVEHGLIERCILDNHDDNDIREFLKKTIYNGLDLIDKMVAKSKESEEYKNYQILNFIYSYNHYFKPYVIKLRKIQDITGYHGDFKDIKIMIDLINKLNYLYNENIFYDAVLIRELIDYLRYLDASRGCMSAAPQEKPLLNDEIINYLKTNSEEYRKDHRFELIYNQAYYRQEPDLDYETKKSYKKMLVGNIGEQLMLCELQKIYNVYYCAKDIGDYVGYDLYYYDTNEKKEKLIEVKATSTISYNDEIDDFNIGITELPKLRSCINDPKADYIIKRVFITFDSNGIKEYKTVEIIAKDENTLIDENGNIYTLYTDKKGKSHFKCENITRKNKLVRN